MIGRLTAVRAFSVWRRVKDYFLGKAQHTTALDSVDDKATLSRFVGDCDIAAAKTKRTGEELEHMDAFCFYRDMADGKLSRRQIYMRGQQSKLEGAYELWMKFVRENGRFNWRSIATRADDPESMLRMDLDAFHKL